MAVIVKYVVVWDGKEDMIFTTKQEAEAHDRMLAIAERLSAYLRAAELPLEDDARDALSVYLAQHREDIGTILRGGKLHSPAVPAPPAGEPHGAKTDAAAAPRRGKAAASTPPTQPQAAA